LLLYYKDKIMLSYYISQSNSYTIRTQVTGSNQFTMSLQDMMGLNTFTASMTNVSYSAYESILAFTASIQSASVGSEYRAVLYNQSGSASIDIWNGSWQVYSSQSIDKSVYENQNTQYVSHDSENKYIIMD
jgi:hypothetical protein